MSNKSRGVLCPSCATYVSRASYERDGCWRCNEEAERLSDDLDFEKFYDLPEAERWRRVWNAIKGGSSK